MRVFLLVSLIMMEMGCGVNASRGFVINNLDTTTAQFVEPILKKIETASFGDPFLHDQSGQIITIRWASPDEQVIDLTMIEIGNYECDVVVPTTYAYIYYDDSFSLFIEHQLGHCFGLRHSNDPTDIMYPTQDLSKQNNDISFIKYIIELTGSRATLM